MMLNTDTPPATRQIYLTRKIFQSNTVLQSLNIVSMMFHLCLIFLWLPHVFSNNVNSYKPVDLILIRCGSSGNSIAGNRNWTGDVNTVYSPTDTPNTVPSVPAAATPDSPQVDLNLYGTARLSHSEFTYSFPVTDGQKFIRLQFYPASYPNFERFNSLFSVKAGPYTLLKDFNASVTADNDDHDQGGTVSREYCLNVEPGQRLDLSFIPNQSHPQAYAFINMIEVVSMPTDLYYTKPFGQGVQIVGQNNEFFPVGNDTALEMMYRIDVGGAQIPPHQDTGMFRNWESDNSYLKKEYARSLPVAPNGEPHYTQDVPNYTAPDQVYVTARSYGMDETSRFNVTWGFEVDPDFNYMVRLHFCEFESNILMAGDRVFQIFIADMMAESHADVILWSGGNLVPTIRDYGVVMLKKPKLTIKLQQHPNKAITVHPDVILNGIEIFKLSYINSLGAPYPDPYPSQLTQPLSNNSSKKKTVLVPAIVVGAILGFIFLFVISLLIIFYRRSRTPGTGSGRGQGSVMASKSSKGHGSSSLPSHLCRYFSIAATHVPFRSWPTLSCLDGDSRNQRPSMCDVVGALEFSLQLQEIDEENTIGRTHEEGKSEQRRLLPQFVGYEESDVGITGNNT